MKTERSGLAGRVNEMALPLREPADLDPLMERIGNAPYVLLGEASHGTEEFYRWRTRISERLIREKGFSFIAVEGDWPDCHRVNRYIKGENELGDAHDVLHAFSRWPTWMWANEEIAELTAWLREFNDELPDEKKVGFYGLDVYSLWDSLHAVMGYLRRNRPEALHAAVRAFQCFSPYGEEAEEYARASVFVPNTCEDEVIALLAELRVQMHEQLQKSSLNSAFDAEQNALVVKNAEAYYRAMIHPGPESWNVRDRHMSETLARLMQHHGPNARGIVWEHNTHVGDAHFTDMAEDGMVNVGQLVREAHAPDDVVIVGFGSHRGNVIAAEAWGAAMQPMTVPPGRTGSWEDVLHQGCGCDRLLLLDERRGDEDFLAPRGHRAIGVVYHPDRERWGNYVPTVLPHRYDAFLYLDETHALHPLHLHVEVGGEAETYPSGV